MTQNLDIISSRQLKERGLGMHMTACDPTSRPLRQTPDEMRKWNNKVVLALGTKGSGVPFLTDSGPEYITGQDGGKLPSITLRDIFTGQLFDIDSCRQSADDYYNRVYLSGATETLNPETLNVAHRFLQKPV